MVDKTRVQRITEMEEYSEEDIDEGEGEGQGALVAGFPEISVGADSSNQGAIPKRKENIVKKKKPVITQRKNQGGEERDTQIQEIQDEIMQKAERDDKRYEEEMEKLQKRTEDEENKKREREEAGSTGTATKTDDTIVRQMGNFNIKQLREKTQQGGYVKAKGSSAFEKRIPTSEEMSKREKKSKYYGEWYKVENRKLHEFIVNSMDGETEEIRDKNRAAATMAGEKIQEAERIRNWRENQRRAQIKSDQEIQDEEDDIVSNRRYWLKKVKALEGASQKKMEKRRDRLMQEIEKVSRAGGKEGTGKNKEQVEPPPEPAPDPASDQEMEEEEGEEGKKDQYQYRSADDPFH
jgi:hypothetical protein